MNYTSQDITNALHKKYINNCKYKVSSIYVFRNDWESDFFLQKANDYCYEFEVKVSKADYKKDFTKYTKHEILSTGKFTKHDGSICDWSKRPNKFYFVVPMGMLEAKDIPTYAGLMVITDKGVLKTIKDAPFLHKNKLKLEEALCQKFYSYWISEKNNRLEANRIVSNLLKDIDDLKKITETDDQERQSKNNEPSEPKDKAVSNTK